MQEEHEEAGWHTAEDEEILNRIAKTIVPKTKAELEETNRRCAEARRYRLQREAAGRDQGELPAGNQTIDPTGPQP